MNGRRVNGVTSLGEIKNVYFNAGNTWEGQG